MKISTTKLNLFLLFKLPAAFFTGVRATYIDNKPCEVKVKHRWVNQNPFKSMFWAVQGMAAELTTGALMLMKIKASGESISMLVANNKGHFKKKALGRITFVCQQGDVIDAVIKKAIETGEGQTIWLHAKGFDASGDEVSDFSFEWTLKMRT